MKTSLQMTGLRELGAALQELDARVQKRLARSAVAAGSRVIVKEAKARVRVDSGTVKKNIRSANLRPEQPGIQQAAVGVRVKGKDAPFYWRHLEFGTAKMAAQPFLRPAFETKKTEAAQAITTQLAKRLDAEAAKVGQTVGKVTK